MGHMVIAMIIMYRKKIYTYNSYKIQKNSVIVNDRFHIKKSKNQGPITLQKDNERLLIIQYL